MSLLQMSFSGAAMILTVVVIRALALHKLPKKTFLALWGVVLVRLLVPYSIPSAFSVYSLAGQLTSTENQTAAAPAAPAVPVLPLEGTAHGAAAIAPDPAIPVFDLWTAVWLLGVLGCGTFFAAAYFKCRREFQASLPVNNDYADRWLQTHRRRRPVTLRQSDRISAPLTYGVFRPVILMPKTTDWTDEEALAYVLAHEYVHICRFDAVTKLVLAFALCVHWFNPLVWIMYVLANRDIELSCDEAVIRGFGERTKSAYAMTLIRMEETKSGLSPQCNHFSKNAIEERIEAIMKYKKSSVFAVALAVVLVFGAATAFAAPRTDQPVDAPGTSAGQEGDVEYRFIPNGQETQVKNILLPLTVPPSRSEEEIQQIITDIESGKIPPLQLPDDADVAVGFATSGQAADGNAPADAVQTVMNGDTGIYSIKANGKTLTFSMGCTGLNCTDAAHYHSCPSGCTEPAHGHFVVVSNSDGSVECRPCTKTAAEALYPSVTISADYVPDNLCNLHIAGYAGLKGQTGTVSFLPSAGCYETGCTDAAHHHYCGADCTNASHYHTCASQPIQTQSGHHSHHGCHH